MKSILIVCLKDEVNLLQASHLISSLNAQNPHSEISVLAYKDMEPAATLLKGCVRTYFLDRNRIEHLLGGSLYSDAFAINTLTSQLQPLLEKKWDQVVNFGNDEAAAYICSALESDKFSGSKISASGSAQTSDRWAAYRNFFSPVNPEESLDPVVCACHSAGAPLPIGGNKIELDQDFTMLANKNFAKIRAGKNHGSAIIVGISLSPGQGGYALDSKMLASLVETIEASEEYKAVLLLQDSQPEKDLCDELNQGLNNKLISVVMDTIAMPSALANLDYLVAPPGTVAAAADLLEAPVIEVVEPADRAVTLGNGCFAVVENNPDHTAEDIIFLLNQERSTLLPMSVMNSENKVFARVSDELGPLWTLIRGPLDLERELRRHISRCYHYSLLGYPINEDILNDLKEKVSQEELTSFSEAAKDEVTDMARALLSTLREAQAIKQSDKRVGAFVQRLDQLMAFRDKKGAAQAAICLFEAAIENIESVDAAKNIEKIEELLFELKQDAQLLTRIIESLLAIESSQPEKTV